MNLDVATDQAPSVIHVGSTGRLSGRSGVGATRPGCQRVGGFSGSGIRNPDAHSVHVRRRSAVRTSGLAAILYLDPERHGQRPLPAGRGIVSDAREARHVCRSRRRLRSRRTVSWVTEPVRKVPVTSADKAIVILGVERALGLLPRMRPRSLNLVERIKAPDACAGSAHLTTEGRLYDLAHALGAPGGITRYPAPGNATPG